MAEAPFDETEFKIDLGIQNVWGEKGYSTNERTGIRPTLEVNGIWGGYIGEGAKTVLPSKAFSKPGMMLPAPCKYASGSPCDLSRVSPSALVSV